MKHKTLLVLLLSIITLPSFAQTDYTELIKKELASGNYPATATFVITDQHTSKHNGVTHIYFRQTVGGVEVYNSNGSIHIDRNHKVVAFVPGLVKNAVVSSSNKTLLPPEAAVSATAAHLKLPVPANLAKTKMKQQQNEAVFTDRSASDKPIKVKLYYYVADHQLVPAYNTEWFDSKHNNWWQVRVNAVTGEIINQHNWVTKCDHRDKEEIWYEQFVATEGEKPVARLDKTGIKPVYNAFPVPVESPQHGSRELLTDPHDSLASPYGWHDTDGVEGVEFTITRGNNVYASEDTLDIDEPGFSPDGGNDLIFDFPYHENAKPSDNLSAAITNLFVWNNFLHDIFYHYGFDEEAGNFQVNNYGRGGIGNDAVMADAQDGSGLSNANFATPPDGDTPRMQMFLWPSDMVNEGIEIKDGTSAGLYDCSLAEFGPVTQEDITGEVVLAMPVQACMALSGDVAGKIVLLERGTCSFVEKVRNAQEAGAIGVIVINSITGKPQSMPGDGPDITIPAVMIERALGLELKSQLATTPLHITLRAIPRKVMDSDMDNGVLTHEYGHGISNRLTGGSANSDCLWNMEQGGEGWSDFFCLVLTTRKTDDPEVGRGIGTWVHNEETGGVGSRDFKYSRNMLVNPLTYNSIKSQFGPHGIGTVWCTILYDLYWDMIDKYGFDSNLFTGTGGNNKMLQLVIDGLKLQPCMPGFVDSRDAILKADSINNGGANSELLWKGFARRGLGYSAFQGSSESNTDGDEAFDMPGDPHTGIGEFTTKLGMQLWPNPNNGSFELILPGHPQQVMIEVFDIAGKCVYTMPYEGAVKINVNTPGLSQGMYYIKAYTDGNVYSGKIIVQ